MKIRVLYPLFFGLALFLYWNSITGGFILDDWAFIAENKAITDTTHPFHFWTQVQQSDYWPISYTIFWLLWKCFELNPLPYHLLNLLLHSGNAVLLVSILTFYQVPYALLGGLLFLIHPVNVQAVAWIFQLKTLLATFFFLLSWKTFIESPQLRLKAWLLYLLSLLSKTIAASFPLALTLHLLAPGLSPHPRKTVGKTLRATLPYFLIALGFLLLTLYVYFLNYLQHGVDSWNPSPLERIVVLSRNFQFYLQKALLPIDLLFIYPRTLPDLSQFKEYLPIGFLILWVGLSLLLLFDSNHSTHSQTRRLVGFGMALYLIGLVPALGFINIPYMRFSFTADHWHYPALIGLPFILNPLWKTLMTEGIQALGPVSRSLAFRSFAWGSLILASLVMVSLTWDQASLYEHEESLLHATLENNPESPFAWYCLGVSQLRFSKTPEAEKAFQKAYLISPGETLALYNLAVLKVQRYDFEGAIPSLQESIQRFPRYGFSYRILGQIYELQGKIDPAHQVFQSALKLHLNDRELIEETCKFYKDPQVTRHFEEEFKKSNPTGGPSWTYLVPKDCDTTFQKAKL